jgi:hypothetical protein
MIVVLADAKAFGERTAVAKRKWVTTLSEEEYSGDEHDDKFDHDGSQFDRNHRSKHHD